MDMVIVNNGKKVFITACFGDPTTVDDDFVVGLFQNNYTIVDGSLISNITESTFTGYASVAVARSTFFSPVIVANVAEITSTVNPTYTCTGGAAQTAYGWFLKGATTGVLYCGANFDSPRSMAPGATEELTPFTMSLKSFV